MIEDIAPFDYYEALIPGEWHWWDAGNRRDGEWRYVAAHMGTFRRYRNHWVEMDIADGSTLPKWIANHWGENQWGEIVALPWNFK